MRHEMTLLPKTLNTQERGISTAVTDEATLGSVWRAAGGSEMDDELLGWPPDVFLLTNILLERSEAHHPSHQAFAHDHVLRQREPIRPCAY
jgi:hypothetical protein